jgi:hypothetical protein
MDFIGLDFLHGWLDGTTSVTLGISLMMGFSKLFIVSPETSLFIGSFILGGGIANDKGTKFCTI